MDFKVYVQGQRIRLETRAGGRPIVILYVPPYAYRLIPTAKIATRFRADALPLARAGGSFDLDTWLRNPQVVRTSLQKQGARRIGTTRLQGVPVDIYATKKATGQPQQKAWLRRTDALPLRAEVQWKNLAVTASWRDYRRARALSSALFAVPRGYKIREGQG